MKPLVATDKRQIDSQIQQAVHDYNKLKEELVTVEAELEAAKSHIPEYEKLIQINNQLQELHDSGSGHLFYGDLFNNEDEFLEHISNLRKNIKYFNKSIEVIKDKKFDVENKIKEATRKRAYLEEDLQILQELEDDSLHDFAIRREITHLPHRITIMPWSSKKEDEKRFRLYVLLAILSSILSAIFIPMWILPVADKQEEVVIPERLAQFIKKKQIKEEAKPKPKPRTEQKVASKEKPTEKETKQARKKASKSGLLAFKNNFADLMDEASEAKLGANAKLSKQGSKSKSSSRSIISDQAKQGSAGINTASLSREVGGAGGKLGAVKFSRVTSDIGTAFDDRPLSDTPGPSRTDEEIQIIFDRYKAALYRIYNRELRKNPTLQGKMVLRITILPDGKVSACKVESTDLKSDVLSGNIVKRVKRFNFGAKDNVPKITILYPIDFLPAS